MRWKTKEIVVAVLIGLALLSFIPITFTGSAISDIFSPFINLFEESPSKVGGAPPFLLDQSDHLKMEWGYLLVNGEEPSQITFQNNYDSPIIVGSTRYNYGTTNPPRSILFSTIGPNSALVSVQRDGGNTFSGTTYVDYLVIEEGEWNLPDGTEIRAGQISTTKNLYYDGSSHREVGVNCEILGFSPTFASVPIVLSSRVSDNNPYLVASTWQTGASYTSEIDQANFCLGIMSGQSTDGSVVFPEKLHWIAIERSKAGIIEGVRYSTDKFNDGSVAGPRNSPYHWEKAYTQTFSQIPKVVIVAKDEEEGGNGAWAYVSENTITSTSLSVVIDEYLESDRSHTQEPVMALSFENPGSYTANTPPRIIDPNFEHAGVRLGEDNLFSAELQDDQGYETVDSATAILLDPAGIETPITLEQASSQGTIISLDQEQGQQQIVAEGGGGGSSWLDGWSYRKKHTLIGSGLGNQNNYQVKFKVYNTNGFDSGENVYLGSNIQAGYQDLRFTNELGTVLGLLDYWIEQINPDHAVVWVEVDNIGINKEIYIYYGNTNAVSTSNGIETWNYFEDFETWNNWKNYSSGGCVQNIDFFGFGVLEKIISNDPNGCYKNIPLSMSDFRFLGRKYRPNTGSGGSYDRFGFEDATFNGYTFYIAGKVSGSGYFGFERREAGSSKQTYSLTLAHPYDNWYIEELTKADSSFLATEYDDDHVEIGNVQEKDSKFKKKDFDTLTVRGGYNYYLDWLAIGNFVNPEPSHGTWNLEETNQKDVEATKLWINYLNTEQTPTDDISRITVNIQVIGYDNSGSGYNKNNAPDLELQLATTNNGGWLNLGTFGVNSPGIYFLTTTDETILNAWESLPNRDLRIRGINIDYGDVEYIDSIVFDSVVVEITYDTVEPNWEYLVEDVSLLGEYFITDIYVSDEVGEENHTEYTDLSFIVISSNQDFPMFYDSTSDEEIIGLNDYVKFNVTVNDTIDEIADVVGTIDGENQTFRQGEWDEWYYIWKCEENATINFTWVGANDDGTPVNWNETIIEGVGVICDTSIIPEEETEPDTGSGSGSGGGAGLPPPFRLDTGLIELRVRQGRSIKTDFKISNSRSKVLDISLDFGDLKRFIVADKQHFTIEVGETHTVNLVVFIDEDEILDVYTGKIIIRGGGKASAIETSIEITEKEPLFDLRSELSKSTFDPGDPLNVNLSITDWKFFETVDVVVYYAIKNFDGEIITYKEETIAIENELNLQRSLKIPTEIKPGYYVFYAEVHYKDNPDINAVTSHTFEIRSARGIQGFFNRLGYEVKRFFDLLRLYKFIFMPIVYVT
ncbi:MAG: DUF2341 domain-containing protein [archaeon]